ncbi:hypothetical protein LCGC14_1868330, partial [marine sediment metagenome]
MIQILLLAILGPLLALGQVYPGGVAGDGDLLVGFNLADAEIAADLDNTATTFAVDDGTGFGDNMVVVIDAEAIFCATLIGNTFSGCVRGFDGTSPSSHSSGATVTGNIVAAHHNALKDEVKAIEQALGVNLSQVQASDTELDELAGLDCANGKITKETAGSWACADDETGTDDQAASEVPFTPAGDIEASDTQAAMEELDGEKQANLGFTAENSANKGAASGYAALDGSSLVVQNPANATATPTGSKIPIAEADGDLHSSWIPLDANYSWTGDHDFASGTRGIPRGATLPGTCVTGDEYMDTNATSGQRHYLCESANTWKLQGDGGGGGGGEANTYSNSGVGGVGVILTKSGVDLPFKSVNAASSKVTVTDDAGNSEVDIDVAEANLTLSNLGGAVTDGQIPAGIMRDAEWTAATAVAQGKVELATDAEANTGTDTTRAVTPANLKAWTASAGSLDHVNLTSIGTNTHAQIDTHLASAANPHAVTKAQVGLANAEDTAISTWIGSANITTVGTIVGGTWQGAAIAPAYGGTGSAYFGVAGPTALRTYTYPDADAAVVTGGGTANKFPVWTAGAALGALDNWTWSGALDSTGRLTIDVGLGREVRFGFDGAYGGAGIHFVGHSSGLNGLHFLNTAGTGRVAKISDSGGGGN